MDPHTTQPSEQPGSSRQAQPTAPPATAGTEYISPIKKALPRLIIGAVVINFIPYLFSLLGKQYIATGETIRDYANAVFVIVFLFIIFKQLTDRGNNA